MHAWAERRHHVMHGEQQRQDDRPRGMHALGGYRRDLTGSSRTGGPPALCAPCAHRRSGSGVRLAHACIILSSCSCALPPGDSVSHPSVSDRPPAPASGLETSRLFLLRAQGQGHIERTERASASCTVMRLGRKEKACSARHRAPRPVALGP
jgi:hypothetical protein